MGDVIKSGKIFLQQKSLFKNQWVEKFCVLYGKSAQNHPYMDFYESYEIYKECKSNSSQKKCEKTIELRHIKAIKQSNQKSSHGHEYLIEIHAKRSKYFFMLKKDSECRSWADKLNSVVDIAEGERVSSSHSADPDPDYPESDDEDCDLSTINQMYESSDNVTRFEVLVEESPLATLCGIVGHVTLLVGHTELAFESPKERKIIYTFSYAWMRRYGKHAKDQFHFEVGRSCPNGAGEVFCTTASSKDIHTLVSKFSKNTSTTKTPAAPDWMKPKVDVPAEPPAVDRSGIGGPTLVANTGRKHPGQSKVPTLVPLAVSGQDSSSSTNTDTQLRDSKRESEMNKEQKHNSGKFKKELEEKLNEDHHQSRKENGSKKFKQKDEKKTKENKDKVAEKEKKPKNKEEKKSVFGGLFSSKKDKEKGKETEKDEQPVSSFEGNIYEEPDQPNLQKKSSKPAPKPGSITDEALYDIADIPQSKPKDSYVYDDASSVTKESKQYSSGPVEYAQPMSRSQMSQGNSYVYADAKEMKSEAWKQHARSEKEEHHMEDYSSIKNVRDEIKQFPPIPSRMYKDNVEEIDDTYDRTNIILKKQNFSENVYGSASRPIGDIVSVPQSKTDSDSDGENLYDEAEYATASDAPSVRAPQEDAYEEADVKPVPKPSKKPAQRKTYTEALYEEVNI